GDAPATHNGHSFDLPVLRYRAMVIGFCSRTPDASVFSPLHGRRTRTLRRAWFIRSRGKVKLDEVSKIIGLTGKPDGVDGTGDSLNDKQGRASLRVEALFLSCCHLEKQSSPQHRVEAACHAPRSSR